MFCCLAGVAAIAAAASSRVTRRLQGALLGGLALGLTGFATWHLDHYAARAAANQRDLLAEIRAAPLCSGTP